MSRTEFKAWIEERCGDQLKVETTEVLYCSYTAGTLKTGIPGFGPEGKAGLDNGFAFCLLGTDQCKQKSYRSSRNTDDCSFWGKTAEGQRITTDLFVACVDANIPIVFEKDGTRGSVLGYCVMEACGRDPPITKLGSIGHRSGTAMLEICSDIGDALVSGYLEGKTAALRYLTEYTWTVANCEVRVVFTQRLG